MQSMTASTFRPSDASGRFITRERAALWADTCAWCGLRSAEHRPDPMTCPGDEDFVFEPSLPSGCLDAARHDVGCDCEAGVCR